MSRYPRVILEQVGAPTLRASWERHPALDRLRLVYGDQVVIRTNVPADAAPPAAARATRAAFRQGHARGLRYLRSIQRRHFVDMEDITHERALLAAAREARLDRARFLRDAGEEPSDERAPIDAAHPGAVRISDGLGREATVLAGNDPEALEDVIETITGGALRKRRPADLAGYLADVGPVSDADVARAFDWSVEHAREKLAALHARSGRTTAPARWASG